jgi:hypothetical protein
VSRVFHELPLINTSKKREKLLELAAKEVREGTISKLFNAPRSHSQWYASSLA